MIQCPPGTVSDTGSVTLLDCYRDPDNFYNVSIVTTEYATNLFRISPFSYYEFDLNFLQLYSQARVPEDYQLLAVFEFLTSPSRSLQSETNSTLRILLMSHTNTGSKHKLPLNLNEKTLFQTNSTLTIGLLAAQSAMVTFQLQFLDGNFERTVNWNQVKVRENTMVERGKRDWESGFVTVLKEKSAGVYEMPVNLNQVYRVNQAGKLENKDLQLENRVFLTLVNFTADSSSPSYPTSLSDQDIWKSLSGFTYYSLPYVPFIGDCSPGYGSFLPLNDLMNDSRCDTVSTPVPIDPYNFGQLAQADHCDITLYCDFGLDLTVTLHTAKRTPHTLVRKQLQTILHC